jgi:hypothetical protein
MVSMMMTIGSSVPAVPKTAAVPNPAVAAAFPADVEAVHRAVPNPAVAVAFPADVEAVHRAVPIPAAVSVHRPA